MTDELEPVWEDWTNGTTQPTARIQQRVYYDHPIVTEFCIQLEYNRAVHYDMDQPAFREVARFDHNIAPNRGHDIREEGLHMDLFPRTEHEKKVEDFPHVPLPYAPKWCRRFLEEQYEHYLGRFEQIAGVKRPERFYD
ncbi:hypothetical protein [Natrinema hispanicum]|uniref:DUF7718 family protein n=1 Tax=Natrinema hispanicum TaxID=392421 RepID=UPI00122D2BBD|nr:hypothetical protein [Natrinema hispanicum]